jgi:hypothetical protein
MPADNSSWTPPGGVVVASAVTTVAHCNVTLNYYASPFGKEREEHLPTNPWRSTVVPVATVRYSPNSASPGSTAIQFLITQSASRVRAPIPMIAYSPWFRVEGCTPALPGWSRMTATIHVLLWLGLTPHYGSAHASTYMGSARQLPLHRPKQSPL